MWNETNLSLETNTAALWVELSGNVSTLFQEVLGTIDGYLSTSVFNLGRSHVTILHQFSTLSPVTEQLLKDTIAPQPCQGQDQGCVLSLREDSYQALSLCDFALCDPFSSDPQCHRGLVTCSCRQGYFKFSSGDRSCTGRC
ncbi:hypothetical protein XELAEV_18032590mg [Xenopus laevis]|uniref:Uncharacterized protein n=1 Tax=Xenopus laevis TaxID=8355 RepID=A0A974CHU9_XENLA|nr:hypothetical protein XELAEV_18032590mg [Xenopus laevis]